MSTITTTPSTTITVQQPGPQWSSVFIQQPWNKRCIRHLYFIHTTIIQKWFFYAQQTSFDQQNHHSSQFMSPSQQPQTQTSNRNEHLIANEDPIILFHEENNDFNEDQQCNKRRGDSIVFPNRDVAILKRHLAQLETYLGSIKYMTRLPDIVIIVDQQ